LQTKRRCSPGCRCVERTHGPNSVAKGPGHRLRGLDGGADDYVIKPFELAELVSRVGAVLRRRGRLPQVIQLGDLMLNRLLAARPAATH